MKYKIPDCVPVRCMQKVVADMIANAVEDYRALVKSGKIVGQKVLREKFFGDKKNVDIQDARGVLHFFMAGVVDEWIELAGLETSPSMIRQKLGLC